VTTPKEYREYADECFGWAKTAKSDRERDIFLQMAHTWLEAASLAETRQTQDDPDPPAAVPKPAQARSAPTTHTTARRGA
jgi:hypothetical protein